MTTPTTIRESTPADTRELRALELYRTRGHEIRQASSEAGQDLYLVPSCTGEGFYTVDYLEETCDCPDFTYRQENCKHILAVGIYAAKRRLRVSIAGDPFAAAGGDPDHDHDQDLASLPHACNDGWVTIGQMVVDPQTGEETEEFAQYLCRRCDEERRGG